MQSIRNKKDIEYFSTQFEHFAYYDENGNKYYFILNDTKREGILTLMKYPNHSWSFHCKGENYCDEGETPLNTEQLMSLLWNHRKDINHSFKTTISNP